MSALARVFGIEERAAPGLKPAAGHRTWVNTLMRGGSRTGRAVTPHVALEHSAVYAGVRTLAEYVGSLPLVTYRDLAQGGREQVVDVRQAQLVGSSPNPVIPAGELWETVVAHLVMWGNAFLFKERDPQGRVIALWPIAPARVAIGLDGQEPIYRINNSALGADFMPAFTSDDAMAVGTRADITHFRNWSVDGISGISPITQTANTLASHLAQEEYVSTWWRNSAMPSGILSTDAKLNTEQRNQLVDSWNAAHGGLNRVARTALLDQSMTWQAITHTLAEDQHLEQRQYAVQDIARILGIPAYMIGGSTGDSLTYENPVQQALHFANSALRIWCNRLERTIQHDDDLWPFKELTCRFNLDEIMRADQKTRYETYLLAVRGGWLSPNDVRIREYEAPVDGLDKYTLNLSPRDSGEISELTKLYSLADASADSNT